MMRRTLLTCQAWAVGALMIYAAVDKLIHPQDFGRAMSAMVGGIGSLGLILQLVLPSLELALGVSLLMLKDPGRDGAVAGLFFTVGSLVILLLTMNGAGCGCFSVMTNPFNMLLNEYPLTRNSALAAMCFFLVRHAGARSAAPAGS